VILSNQELAALSHAASRDVGDGGFDRGNHVSKEIRFTLRGLCAADRVKVPGAKQLEVGHELDHLHIP